MTRCPGKSVLLAFEAGNLADAEAFPLERHLQDCNQCRSAMHAIRKQDPEITDLRDLLDPVTANPQDFVEPRKKTPTGWEIPDYERIVLAGEGSYGSVWVVRDRVGVYRALKMIDTARLANAGVRCREREALEVYMRNITRHPYLVSIYHVGVVGEILYYTMELADNQSRRIEPGEEFPANYRPLTLKNIIRGGRLPIDVAMEVARRLLRGLSKVHALELVHRDIKPSNIVFVQRRPKLADIGMMTTEAYGSGVVGTPEYMPPDRVMDQTADTYAFGKVLFEMLAGPDRDAFPILPDDDRWFDSRWPRDRVQHLLEKSSERDAKDRYPTAIELLEDLEACTEPTFEVLYEKLAENSPPDRRRELIQLGYAALRTIPWIVGLVALLAVLEFFRD